MKTCKEWVIVTLCVFSEPSDVGGWTGRGDETIDLETGSLKVRSDDGALVQEGAVGRREIQAGYDLSRWS